MTMHNPPEDARWLVASVLAVRGRGPACDIFDPDRAYGEHPDDGPDDGGGDTCRQLAMDAGCGSGVVGLRLLEALPRGRVHVTLLDNDPALVALADQALVMGAWCDHAHTVYAEVTAWVAPAPYDLILTNPPYRLTTHGHTAAAEDKRRAHTITPEGLAAWFGALRGMLAEGGVLAAILHPDCLSVLAHVMRDMDAVVWPLQTHPARAPKRVVVHWRMGTGKVDVRGAVAAWEAGTRERVLGIRE